MHNSRATPFVVARGKRVTTRQIRIYPRPYATTLQQRSAERPNENHSSLGAVRYECRAVQHPHAPSTPVHAWNNAKPTNRANYEPKLGKLVYIYPQSQHKTLVPKPQATVRDPKTPTLQAVDETNKKKRGLILLLGTPSVIALAVALCALAFGPNKKPTAPISHIHTIGTASNETSVVRQHPSVVAANYSLPALLKIPKIKVDAQILYSGLNGTGNIAAPADITHVGWYKYGALPGNAGSAVIVGHLDGLKGQPGVFSNLSKLQPGDTVIVLDDKDQTTTFVVRALQTYTETEKPDSVFTSTGGSHLNLITCAGTWDMAQHRYSQRLVVFTDKI